MIELILFDLGGPLLADDDPALLAPLIVQAVRHAGAGEVAIADADALLRRAVSERGTPVVYALWQICRPNRASFERARESWRNIWNTHVPPLREGVPAVLDVLRRGRTLGLYTAYSTESQARLVAAAGLERFFPVRVELSHPKPDPRGLLGLIEAYGGRPEATVVVGDRCDRDVAPARRAGVRSVWMRVPPWGEAAPHGPDEEPDVEIRSLAELPEALTRLAATSPGRGAEVAANPAAPAPLWRSRSCFACGTENHVGLDLAAYREGAEVRAVYRPKPAHRGWSKLVHGGILATALDEVVCLAAAQTTDSKVVTVKAELRYLAPAFLDRTYTVRAWPTEPDGRYLTAEGQVEGPDGKPVARMKLHCLPVPEAQATAFLDRDG